MQKFEISIPLAYDFVNFGNSQFWQFSILTTFKFVNFQHWQLSTLATFKFGNLNYQNTKNIHPIHSKTHIKLSKTSLKLFCLSRSNMDKSKSFRAASSAKPITHHHHQHKSSTAAFLDRHRTTSEGNTQFDIKRYTLFFFKFRFFPSKHNIQFLYFVI